MSTQLRWPTLGGLRQRAARMTGADRLGELRGRVEECRIALAENTRLAIDLERQVGELEHSLVPLLEARASRHSQ